MNPEQPKQLTPDEIAEIEKSRTISDEELLKRGARYVTDDEGKKRLSLNDIQEENFRRLDEMKECADHKERVWTLIRAAQIEGSREAERMHEEFEGMTVVYEGPNGEILESRIKKHYLDAKKISIPNLVYLADEKDEKGEKVTVLTYSDHIIKERLFNVKNNMTNRIPVDRVVAIHPIVSFSASF